MNLDEAKLKLLELRELSTGQQLARMDEVNEAFQVFWDSKPDQQTFAHHTSKIVLGASMLYYMIVNPPK